MVTGFEYITSELTPFEEEIILPLIVNKWEKKQVGAVVSMKEMIEGVNKFCKTNGVHKYRKLKSGKITIDKYPYTTTGPRMRKIIHYIRVKNLVKNLIATSDGYYKTQDLKEIENYIKSCRERANSFLEIANAMQTYTFER